MTAYVDSSAILRFLMKEPGAVTSWRTLDETITSSLTRVECLRTMDRIRHTSRVPARELDGRLRDMRTFLDGMDLVELSDVVLARASDPLPMPLGTLDAVHLATALLWRERAAKEMRVITHDAALARAARMFGFEVVGVDAGGERDE